MPLLPASSALTLAAIAILALCGCKPIRSDIFRDEASHTPDETLPPDAGTPDAGTAQPPDSGMPSSCYADRILGQDVAFALDARGVGHFAYVQAQTLFVATTLPGDIPRPIPDIQADSLPKLAVDARGHRHLLPYWSFSYVHDREGTWTRLDIPTYGALEADPSGVAHVLAFRGIGDGSSTGLVYTSNRSGSWSWPAEPIASFDFEWEPQVDFKVDAQGHAHVAYVDMVPPEHVLHYATNVSGTWVTEQVDAGPASWPVLAIDSAGEPHLLYVNRNSLFIHATKATGVWRYSTVDPEPTQTWVNRSALLVDTSGTVHALLDRSTSSTRRLIDYASNAGGHWSSRQLLSKTYATSTAVLDQTTFVLDAEGRPVVGYEYRDDFSDKAFHFAQPRPCP